MTIQTLHSFSLKSRILQLLSDDDVARVSRAESEPRLNDGDEYLDLERLEQGVRRAAGASPSASHLLPRKTVRENTWRMILTQLATSASRVGSF